jgi:hypothetical protein
MNTIIRRLLTMKIMIIPKPKGPIGRMIYTVGESMIICGLILIACLAIYQLGIYGFVERPSSPIRNGLLTGIFTMWVGVGVACIGGVCKR